MGIKALATLGFRNGSKTDIGFDFESGIQSLATKGNVDVYIVSTESGFSPLGAAMQFLDSDLGISRNEISRLADWNRFENKKVTLVALRSRRNGSCLHGAILAPCENSTCYERFATPLYGNPHRDFYYNVTFEAIAYANKYWAARKLAISHLSASGHFHEDIATCNAEALAHYCDTVISDSIKSFLFAGCCISIEHLAGIRKLNAEADIGHHKQISTEIETRTGYDLVHLSWAETN